MSANAARAKGILRLGLSVLLLLLTWNCIGPTGVHLPARADSSWLSPTNLSDSTGESQHPALAVTSHGAVHVFWEAAWEGKPCLWHAWLEGGRWQGPEQLLMGGSPAVAASGETLHLVYVNEQAGWQRIFYCTWRDGALSPPVPISSPGANCTSPRLAVDATGTASIIWVRNPTSGQPTLYYATASDGPSFAEMSLYPYSSDGQGQHPALAIDTSGRLHATWEASDGADLASDVYYSRQTAIGWGIPCYYVSFSADVPSSCPDIALDAAGVAHFLWQEGPKGGTEVLYHHDVGKLGSGGQVISTGESRANAPRLAIDSRDGLHAVWDEGTTLRYRRAPAPGETWQPIETVASALAIAEAALAVEPQGVAHVAWAQREANGALAIYYSRRWADPPTPTPLTPTLAATATTTSSPAATLIPLTATSSPTTTLVAPTPAATSSPTPPPPTAVPSASWTPEPSTATQTPARPTVSPSPIPETATATPRAASPTAPATNTPMPPPATMAPSPYPGRLTRTPDPSPTPDNSTAITPEAQHQLYLPRAERPATPNARDASRAAGRPTATATAHPPSAVAAAALAPREGTPPVCLSDTAVSARRPAIAATGDGTIHIVWEQGEELYHTYKQGQSWSTPALVATGNSPALAAGPGGSLHLAFVNEFGGNFEIYHVRWNGSTWSLPRNVSRTSSGASSLPAIAVAADGSVHIAWTETLPGYPVIYYARGYPGPFETMPVPNARGSAPALALTGPGAAQTAVHLAWQDQEGDPLALEIFYTVLENGVWTLAQNVSASPTVDSRRPDMAVEGSEVRLVWQEDNASRTVRTVRGHDGWWPVSAPVSPENEPAYLPAVASAGNVTHIAWDSATAVRLIQAWVSAPAWSQPVTLVAGVSEASDVAIAATPDQQAHIAWAERQGDRWSIHYTSHAFRPPYVCHLGLVMH